MLPFDLADDSTIGATRGAPARGSQTHFGDASGIGAQWFPLVRLATDDQELAGAIEANGWNLQQRTLRALGR